MLKKIIPKPNSLSFSISQFLNFCALTTLCLSILLPANTSCAQQPSIIINEIAAFEPTNHEWIEIHNPTDQEVDITDWKFSEGYSDSKPDGINHSLIAFQGDFLIQAGEYAIIAQNAENFVIDHPDLSSNLTIIDSSWGTLSEAGEQIALKDSENNVIEQFVYLACPEFSLERKNPNLMDYTDHNWQQHPSGATPGTQNSVRTEYYSVPTNHTQNDEQSINQETPEPTPQTNSETTKPWNNEPQKPTNYSNLIIINEILPNPEGSDDAEFIELKNLHTQTINLKDFTISDSSNKTFTITNSITIGPNQFWVLPKLETKISLNNSGGDMIGLYQPNGVLIDTVHYSEDAESGWSYSKKDSGTWSWTTTPTKNQENIITLPHPPESTQQTNNLPAQTGKPNNQNNQTTPPLNNQTIEQSNNYSNEIIISELLPNPRGSDQAGEWVELHNNGNHSVNLSGWKLGDNSSNKYFIDSNNFSTTTIEPGEYFLLLREITNIALNNTGGDLVNLYDPADNLVDNVEYTEKAVDDMSYALIDGEWLWTTSPTPADENILTQINQPPQAFFEIDGNQLDQSIVFDASESYDPESQPLMYIWNFDQTTSTPTTTPIITRVFAVPGKHQIKLTVQDEQGLNCLYQQSLTIKSSNSEFPNSQTTNYQLLITEFFPNPAGTDENHEWIEVFNLGSEVVNLMHCKLDDVDKAGSRAFLIEQDLLVEPGEYLIFERQQTKIALNNTYDSVRLIDPFDNIIHEISYDDVPENMSYALDEDNSWFWTSTPTPGEENKITQLKMSLTSSGSQSRNYSPILTVDIDKIKQYDIGDKVKTTGIVSVEPGTLGKNIFYIYSPELKSGIQIYSYHKDFPDLKIGDTVEITGTLSQSMGEERLKISAAGDIKTISNPDTDISLTPLEPQQINIEDLSDSSVGSLVSISGEVVETKGAYVYIDDGTEELKIYLKQSTDASAKKLEPGDQIEITGIFSETTSGFRLLPRSQQDIKIQKILGESTNQQGQQKIILEQNNKNQTFIRYLLVTIIALLIILIGLFLKKKKK